MKKGVKLRSLLAYIFFVLILLIAVALVGVRIMGYTPYAILSGSMSPEYEPGDLIYVKEASREDIKEGDVITFVSGPDLTTVTHRVAGIDEEGRYITKGDANEAEDANPVLYENVIGKAEFSIPKLGYVSAYLKSRRGRYAGIGVILILILLIAWPERKTKEG